MAYNKTKLYTHIIGQGMDAGLTDAKIAAQNLIVKNGVFRKQGQVTKREGVSDTGIDASDRDLLAYDGESVISIGGAFNEVSSSVPMSTEDGSRRSMADLDISQLAKLDFDCIWSDAAKIADDIVAVSAVKDGSASSMLYALEESTGAIIDDLSISTAHNVFARAIYCDELTPKSAFAWAQPGSRPIYIPVDTTTGSIGSTVTIPSAPAAVSSSPAELADACYHRISGDAKIIWAYCSATGGGGSGDITVADEDGNFVTVPGTVAPISCIAVTPFDGSFGSESVLVVYGTGNDLKCFAVNVVSMTATAIATIRTISPTSGGYTIVGAAYESDLFASSVAVTWSWCDNFSTFPHHNRTEQSRIDVSPGTPSPSTYRIITTDGELLATIPNNTRSAIGLGPFVRDVSSERTMVVLRDLFDSDGNYLGETFAQIGTDGLALSQNSFPVTKSNASGLRGRPCPRAARKSTAFDTKFYFGCMSKRSETTGQACYAVYNTEVEQVLESRDQSGMQVSCGASLRVAKGKVSNVGFYHAPIVSAANAASGTALTSGISYRYIACYYRLNAAGDATFGPMSKPVELVSNGNDADVSATCHDLSVLPSTVFDSADVLFFRTEAATDAYYLVGTTPSLQGAASVSIVDSTTDASIRSNAPAYTNSRNIYQPLPASRMSGIAKNRLWLAKRDEESTEIWYSNKKEEGAAYSFTGPSSNVSTYGGGTIRTPSTGGRITGIVELLDRVVIFKERSIYATDGEGFDERWQGTQFTEPYAIDLTLGCINPRSIVKFGSAIAFLSDRGIYTIGADMSVQPLGLQIKYFTDQYTINGAHALPVTSELVFTTSNVSLVYNWVFGQWSIWGGLDCVSSTFDGDKIWFINPNGDIYKQNGTIIDGSNTWITMEVITPWISRAGAGGYQRLKSVQILGNIAGGTNFPGLYIDVGYQYDRSVDTEQHVFEDTSTLSFTDDDYYSVGGLTDQAMHVKIRPNNTRANAYRLRIRDYNPSDPVDVESYQGASLTLAIFEFTGMPGGSRRTRIGSRL
jgi:hypothetical protein